MGLLGLEPRTSRLSGERSDHLSYRPLHHSNILANKSISCQLSKYSIEIIFPR